MIRSPIVVVGGHVDHGKTTLLDYLRGSLIAEKEAGRITQHIGATEIPLSLIQTLSGELLNKYGFNLKIPGLLFIDTPGHEAFSSLRKRGCSIADIGVLVIDILQGIQPQTIEVINFLKENKVPFVVALTKIDKIKGYEKKQISELLKEINNSQTMFAQEFNRNIYSIMSKFSELDFDSDRFDNVLDFTKKILLIPVNSKEGFGIPELLLFLAGLSQKFLEKNLALNVEGNGKAVVLETNEIKGFGKTADIILYDGKMLKNDLVKIDTSNNYNIAKIKQLLRPKPLTDLRTVKTGFMSVDEVYAATGLKIALSDSNLINAGDELTVISEEESKQLECTKKCITTLKEKGVVVKVDTEGSLDAFIELAKKNNVNIGKICCGNVSKEDILEAKLFSKDDFLYGVIFAFNLKINPEIEQYAKEQNIKIFESNVIYKLFEDYLKWSKTEIESKKNQELKDIKYPAKVEIFKDCVFRKSKPCVLGVKILDGVLKPNTKIVYNNKIIGTLKQMQIDGKVVNEAKKNAELAISFDDISFEKDIDLNVTNIFYTYIPTSQRSNVEKYLKTEFPDLIEEIKDIYLNSNI